MAGPCWEATRPAKGSDAMNVPSSEAPCHAMISYRRPRFPNARSWLAHAQESLREGREPWPPISRDELRLALEYLPERTRTRWLPAADNLALLGLPGEFGTAPSTWDELEQERFLATLAADAEFRIAVRHFLLGGAT